MKYVFVDPSGSFNEGKGHTGIAVCEDNLENLNIYSLAADKYITRHQYWEAILNTILSHGITESDVVIIEGFMIRTTGFLMGKMPETIQFIGALSWELENRNIPYYIQTPTQAKSRFTDDSLVKYIPNFEKKSNRYYLNGHLTNDHIRDALKHLLYFMRYRKEKLYD